MQASASLPDRADRLSESAPWLPVLFLRRSAHEFPFQSPPRALRFPVERGTLSEAHSSTTRGASVSVCVCARARQRLPSICGAAHTSYQIKSAITNIPPNQTFSARAAEMIHLPDALLRDRALDIVQVTVL